VYGGRVSTGIATVRCEVRLSRIEGRPVIRLPQAASAKLPSRGQVAVEGTLNGAGFATVLEPDGAGGHWMNVDERLATAAGMTVDRGATLELEVSKQWPEPVVPADLRAALASAPRSIQEMWQDITPMARWEWVRWVNATRNPATRERRVEVTISKMEHGKRRPCCFDLSACTDPELSRSGVLLGTTAPRRSGRSR
jgi:hypothetical protein